MDRKKSNIKGVPEKPNKPKYKKITQLNKHPQYKLGTFSKCPGRADF